MLLCATVVSEDSFRSVNLHPQLLKVRVHRFGFVRVSRVVFGWLLFGSHKASEVLSLFGSQVHSFLSVVGSGTMPPH